MPAIKRKVFGLTNWERDVVRSCYAERDVPCPLASSIADRRKLIIETRMDNDGMPVTCEDSVRVLKKYIDIPEDDDLFYHEQDCSCSRCRQARSDNA